MSRIKQSIEKFFEFLGHLIYKNRLKSMISIFVLIGILSAQLPNLKVDTTSEAMLASDDPTRIEYNDFRDQFGRDEVIIVAIESSRIFTRQFLEKLKSLHNDLETGVPYVKEVRSLINARNTYSKGDVLYVDELLKDWPESPVDLNLLKNQVMGNPLFINNIISEDGGLTAVIIETQAKLSQSEDIMGGFDETVAGQSDKKIAEEKSAARHYLAEKETGEAVDAVRKIMTRYRESGFSMTLSGGPVIIDSFNKTTMKDMTVTTSVCMAGIIFFLFILFRRVSGVILPLLIIETAALSTFGIMAVCGAPFSVTTNALVCFLLAVGVADSVHILTIFYMKFSEGLSKEDAISYALGHSGLAVALTSLTTAAGLLSFAMSELSPIADVGIYGAVGVILAFLYTIVLLPSLIAFIPLKLKPEHQYESGIMQRVLLFLTDFSTGNPKKIVSGCVIVFIISIISMFNLSFSLDTIECFPDSAVTKKDALFIDKQLNGMTALEVVIDTKKENGICDPDILNRIEEFSSSIEKIYINNLFVGKVFSINDIVKETNRALNANDANAYIIPQERDLIRQELFLFENSGSEDLERLVDTQLSKTRITIKAPFVDGMIYEGFITEIKSRLEAVLPDTVDVSVTGAVALTAGAMTKALYGMSKSYVIAFVVITIMIFLLVGDIKLGTISMIPNLLPIIFVMGIMGMVNIPLDMTTIMIGCFAMGLVVDDTVHFMYNFQKYYTLTGDSYQAVKKTLLGVGRALVITSMILCAAFFSDLLASLVNIKRFGFFTGITIISALLADLIVVPALMTVVMKKSKVKEETVAQKVSMPAALQEVPVKES